MRRGAACGAVVVACAAGVVATGAVTGDGGKNSAGSSAACARYCVTVTPASGGEGTLFRFVGRAWRPNRKVQAFHGDYCEGDCDNEGFVARVRTNRRGGWVFRFRYGYREAGDRERGIISGEPSVFAQWIGRPYQSRQIRRKAPHRIEG